MCSGFQRLAVRMTAQKLFMSKHSLMVWLTLTLYSGAILFGVFLLKYAKRFSVFVTPRRRSRCGWAWCWLQAPPFPTSWSYWHLHPSHGYSTLYRHLESVPRPGGPHLPSTGWTSWGIDHVLLVVCYQHHWPQHLGVRLSRSWSFDVNGTTLRCQQRDAAFDALWPDMEQFRRMAEYRTKAFISLAQ